MNDPTGLLSAQQCIDEFPSQETLLNTVMGVTGPNNLCRYRYQWPAYRNEAVSLPDGVTGPGC